MSRMPARQSLFSNRPAHPAPPTGHGTALILGLASVLAAVGWVVYLSHYSAPLTMPVGIAALIAGALGVFGPEAYRERFMLAMVVLAGSLVLVNTLSLFGVHLI